MVFKKTFNNDNLTRFLEAQSGVYEKALEEIKNGKKAGHWMWFIFPQISGLGFSEMAKFYAIKNKADATSFLNHPVLGSRLIEISNELLMLKNYNSVPIFGTVDSMKLKSSMTLFSLLEDTNPIFGKVIEQFFSGKKDEATVILLNKNL